jgi:hypothetical protein
MEDVVAEFAHRSIPVRCPVVELVVRHLAQGALHGDGDPVQQRQRLRRVSRFGFLPQVQRLGQLVGAEARDALAVDDGDRNRAEAQFAQLVERAGAVLDVPVEVGNVVVRKKLFRSGTGRSTYARVHSDFSFQHRLSSFHSTGPEW